MVKNNFTKVEMLLTEGLMQVQANNWLELADIASGKGDVAKNNPERVLKARKAVANLLQHELKFMYKENPQIYMLLGIEKDKLFKIFDKPDKINDEDYEYISGLKNMADAFRKGKQAMITPEQNEELIENQRKQHVNKRFNVNDKWLPLR